MAAFAAAVLVASPDAVSIETPTVEGRSSAPQPPSEAAPFAQSFADPPTIDLQDKFDVTRAYHDRLLPPFEVAPEWTGDVATCEAGTTSQAYENATLDVVNWFRDMAGLSTVVFENRFDTKAQEAALMMKAKGEFSHSPDPSWPCYTPDGADGAANSNLFVGSAGPSAVYGYMWDFDGEGVDNSDVGHRRWILDPVRLSMGTGSTDTTNALWLFGNTGPRPAGVDFVAWPPPGYAPLTVAFPRWSFAPNHDVVDLSAATVTMAQDGTPIAVEVVSNDPGAGDDTIVWEPQELELGFGMRDSAVTVTIADVEVDGVVGDYTYDVTIFDPHLTVVVLGGTGAIDDDTANTAANAATGIATRIAGVDRFDTAAQIADAFDPGVAAVFIATANDFPDALAGGPAAAKLDAPILLVAGGIPAATQAQLSRLQPQNIYVLGGIGAVSGQVEKDLAAYTTGDVIRLAGSDRFTTAEAISAEHFAPKVPVVYIGTGLDFPDALAGGVAAATEGGPMLLTMPDALPTATRRELARLEPGRIVVLGGSAAVSEAVVAELEGYTTGAVTRLAGADRYSTAAAISQSAFPDPVHRVYLAVGTNFPDALAGVPVAAREGAPILLVQATSAPPSTLDEIRRLDW